MRIRWQSFVDFRRNAPYLERLGSYLNEIADPGTAVDVVGVSPPDRDFGRLTEFRCSIIAVDNVIDAEECGYDACVIGHFQDPGLYEARSAVPIPVIGTGEATMHFAAQLGRRIALVTLDRAFEVWHLEQAEKYGLTSRVTGIAGLGFAPEDFNAAFAGDRPASERLIAAFRQCAAPLVEAGADVVIPAGVLPGLLLCREHALKIGHAPVVNCAAIALKAAEMWVKLRALNGLDVSRGPSFALAPRRAVDDFRALVARGRPQDPGSSQPAS